MRRVHVALGASAVLLAFGALGAGCISSSSSPDAGGSDAGGFDAFVPGTDGGPTPTLDAGVDSAPAVDAGGDASPTGTLSATTVDFGLVGCGTGTGTQTYSFQNTGTVAIDYAATVSSGAVFSLDGASSGSVAPGATGTLTIKVASIPTTSIAGTPILGAVTLTTNVPGFTSVTVPLSVTPQGGSLTVSPAVAGFGQVQLTTDGTPIPLTISNVGNAPVTITFGAPAAPDGGAPDSEFGLTYKGSPAGALIAAGGTLADAGATFHPTTAGLKNVTATIQTSDPLCASAATAVAMSGTGSAAQVTIGPDPLQFGSTLCGQTGAALQVTLKNSSPAAVAFTDALKLGATSPFTIDVGSGSIPGGTATNPGKAIITVTPKKITAPASVVPGAFNDTLVVTPTAPGLTPTSISLQQSAAGAVLAVSMASTAFGTVQNQPATLPFTVTNTGNRDAPLTVTAAGAGYSAAFTGSATATADGGTAPGKVTFDPSANGADNGTLTVTTTEALCAATPPTLSLTATGAVPVAGYPTAAIALASTCGAGAGSAGSLTVTNSGSSPLTISGVASKSGYFTFTTPGTIAAGGTGTISLTASALGVGAGYTGGSTLSDSLSFTTNEVGSPSHTVPVTVAVSGANLAFSGGNTATLTTCGGVPYSVVNTGNVNAYVTAGGTYPNDADNAGDPKMFRFLGTFATATLITAGGAAVSDTLAHDTGICAFSSTCTFAGTQTFTSTNAAGSQAGICIPLPALDLSLAFTFNCTQCC